MESEWGSNMIYDKYRYKVNADCMVRVITNTDAKNEADDQYAIVHALLSPKFDNVGLIAAHFGTRRTTESMQESYDELITLLDLMRFPRELAYRGAKNALPDEQTPVESDGARLIIEEAMKDDPRPLFVTFLGPLTDLASAYLMEPRIAGRLTAIWIGGGPYPNGGQEFNLSNDIHAANVIMKSEIDLWQVPQDVYQMVLVSLAELELRVAPYGKIGDYLFQQMLDHAATLKGRSAFRTGESWALGDSPVVGLILAEHRFRYKNVPAPIITHDMHYVHTGKYRPIKVYHFVDSRFIMEDFYAKLQLFAQRNSEET